MSFHQQFRTTGLTQRRSLIYPFCSKFCPLSKRRNNLLKILTEALQPSYSRLMQAQFPHVYTCLRQLMIAVENLLRLIRFLFPILIGFYTLNLLLANFYWFFFKLRVRYVVMTTNKCFLYIFIIISVKKINWASSICLCFSKTTWYKRCCLMFSEWYQVKKKPSKVSQGHLCFLSFH